jgi:hypothetical protein
MTIENSLETIASSLDDIYNGLDPANSFGLTVGDQLQEQTYQISRVADSLELIVQILKNRLPS